MTNTQTPNIKSLTPFRIGDLALPEDRSAGDEHEVEYDVAARA